MSTHFICSVVHSRLDPFNQFPAVLVGKSMVDTVGQKKKKRLEKVFPSLMVEMLFLLESGRILTSTRFRCRSQITICIVNCLTASKYHSTDSIWQKVLRDLIIVHFQLCVEWTIIIFDEWITVDILSENLCSNEVTHTYVYRPSGENI